MKNSRLLHFFKQGYFVVPLYLFPIREKLSLSMEDFVFLMYLANRGEKSIFDPTRMCKDLGLDLPVVLQMISTLSDLHLIEVRAYKNDKGFMEEEIDLSAFYDRVFGFLIEEVNQGEERQEESIFEVFEREFGRTLSPMEYEIIKAWIDSKIPRELIIKALKEAVYNGVSNLRYIDKILYEWGKKQFQTVKDVDEYQNRRREEKKEKPKSEVFDYNWFDEEE